MTTLSDQKAIADGCYFSQEKADKAIGWIEHNLGVTLYQWQRQLLNTYFGWRKQDGGYRFSTISCWIPKKNGKSYLISALLGYKLFELKDCNLYSVAYNSKQASIVLDGLINLMRKSKTLRRLVDSGQVKCFSSPYRREIQCKITNVKYVALADNENANDGLVGQLLIVDELHRMKSRLYDISKGCLRNIVGGTEIIISTAGSGDKNHRSWQKYSYAKSILNGTVIDTSVLPVIYENNDTLTTADEIYSLEALLKCNPILVEDEVKRAEAIREINEARINRNDCWYRRHILNQWVQDDGEVYIEPSVYGQAEIPEPANLSQYKVCLGLDKGGQWDFSAVTALYDLGEFVFEKQFTFAVDDRLPLMAARDDVNYNSWAKNGELTVIPADAVADEWLVNWLLDFCSTHDVVGIAADPNAAGYIVERLYAAGYYVCHVQQSNNRLLSPVIDDYAERTRQHRIRHARNSLYDWQLANATKLTTAKDCLKIVKKGSSKFGKGGTGHIDNVDSAINALALLRTEELKHCTVSAGITVG